MVIAIDCTVEYNIAYKFQSYISCTEDWILLQTNYGRITYLTHPN